MLTRASFAGLLTALLLAGIAVPASADDGWGNVGCTQTSDPGCDVGAGTGGSTGGGGPTGGGGSGAPRVCKNPFGGKEIPCWRDDAGWFGERCYFKEYTPTADEQEMLGPPKEPGVWYFRNCPTDDTGFLGMQILQFYTNPPVAVPQIVALHALSRLKIPTLSVAVSPAGEQLVRLPSWWWFPGAAWQPQSATAAVPGVTVIATATPYKSKWNAGDGGGDFFCTGQGTPWTGGDPRAVSPDCGSVFQRSSASAPGGAFQMQTTVYWRITWAGAGAGGTLPDMQTVTTTPVRVAESQTVITR